VKNQFELEAATIEGFSTLDAGITGSFCEASGLPPKLGNSLNPFPAKVTRFF